MSKLKIVERIFFGIDFPNLNNKNNIKRLKIITMFQLLMIISLILFAIYFINSIYPSSMNTKIEFYGLNESEKDIAKSLINELDYDYLHVNKKIIFTKNLTKTYCSIPLLGCTKEENFQIEHNAILGVNYIRNINILYTSDKEKMKSVLCHESIHSLLFPPQERFVYDLNQYLPCYKK